jgi:hypothetical protein
LRAAIRVISALLIVFAASPAAPAASPVPPSVQAQLDALVSCAKRTHTTATAPANFSFCGVPVTYSAEGPSMVQQCLANAPYDRTSAPLPPTIKWKEKEPLFEFWFHCKPSHPGSPYRDDYVYIVKFLPKGADWRVEISFFAPE